MDSKDIVEWLNNRTGSNLRSLKEAQTCKEICYFLADSMEEYHPLIQSGVTLEERTANFELARELFEHYELKFAYDIQKLAKGERAEFMRFAIDVMSLDADNSASEGNNLDDLLAELEANLDQKMKEVEDFKAELDECATERNFYLSKLTRIEKICDEYPEKDADAVIQILSVSSNDFQPPPE